MPLDCDLVMSDSDGATALPSMEGDITYSVEKGKSIADDDNVNEVRT